MTNGKIIKEHVQENIIVDYCLIPEHEDRDNSDKINEFERAKRKLKQDGHTKCFICGCESTEDNHIEYHHFLVEDCLNEDADMNKLWELAKIFDLYGYGKKATCPPKSCNHEMNLMPLCEHHHRGSNGVHNNSFSTFIIQKLMKNNLKEEDYPVPQDEDKLGKIKDEYKKEHLK